MPALVTYSGAADEIATQNLECFHDDQASDHGIGRRYCRDYVASHR